MALNCQDLTCNAVNLVIYLGIISATWPCLPHPLSPSNSEEKTISHINIFCITCNQNFVKSGWICSVLAVKHHLPKFHSWVKEYINTQFWNFWGCQTTPSLTKFLKIWLLIMTSSVSPNFSCQWVVGLFRPFSRREIFGIRVKRHQKLMRVVLNPFFCRSDIKLL